MELGGGGCWWFTKKLYDATVSIPPSLFGVAAGGTEFCKQGKGVANKENVEIEEYQTRSC